MKQTRMIPVTAIALWAALAPGCGPGGAGGAALKDNLAIIQAVTPSIVHVEYTLQYDRGEAPRGGAWGSFDQYVREERPREVPGLLLAADKVIAPDLMVHPRFVKGVAVRFGRDLVDARITAYAIDRNAVVLTLARPLKGAQPVAFHPDAKGPYRSVSHSLRDEQWITNVRGAPVGVTVSETGRKYHPAAGCWLIVDAEGRAVGVCSAERLDTAGKWKGSPLDWPARSAKEMAERLAATRRRVDAGVFRVALSFRSPKKSAGAAGGTRRPGRSPADGQAEQNVVGMLIDDRTVVVLANLRPKLTARLERITVHTARGGPVQARFSHTLKDYGCFLARLDKPVGAGLTLSDKPITGLRNHLLMAAEVTVHGENRVTYFDHRRIRGYTLGWKRHVLPQIGGKAKSLFLFDADGRLLAFPLARRQKLSTASRYSGSDVRATPASRLRAVLGDLAAHTDPSNVPLVAEEESRLAWLGVELQPLNRELARLNNLSDLTRDGQIGALVSYIYPGSPADQAGVTAGPDHPPWFLINLNVEGDPKPIDVKAERELRVRAGFPWSQWDRLPPTYWDGKFPTPWQPAETTLNRTLTDLGFGKKLTATFFTQGRQVTKTFEVVPSPTHYESASTFKSTGIGVTVRDMTFEVRRYFLKGPKDPGVIVSAVEPGSAAGVGGIKPYEIITHVNDRPVTGVKDFEKLITGGVELRLTVVRMTTGRMVKLRPAGP